MQFTDFSKLDLNRLPSPAFVVDQIAIERNLKILREVADASGAKILAALKAFSMWELGPLTARYLDGTCASGLHEARLGHEEYQAEGRPNEVHVYSAAYSEADVKELLTFVDHMVFNSTGQWQRFQPLIQAALAERPDIAVRPAYQPTTFRRQRSSLRSLCPRLPAGHRGDRTGRRYRGQSRPAEQHQRPALPYPV